MHQVSEWRKLGDILWEAVLEDDKTAKKLGKVWRIVQNALLQQLAEKRAAEEAIAAAKTNTLYSQEHEPLAPSVSTIVLPAPGLAASPVAAAVQNSLEPSAPPLKETESRIQVLPKPPFNESPSSPSNVQSISRQPPVPNPVPGAQRRNKGGMLGDNLQSTDWRVGMMF